MDVETTIRNVESIEINEPLELNSGRWARDITVVTETGRYTIGLYTKHRDSLDVTETVD